MNAWSPRHRLNPNDSTIWIHLFVFHIRFKNFGCWPRPGNPSVDDSHHSRSILSWKEPSSLSLCIYPNFLVLLVCYREPVSRRKLDSHIFDASSRYTNSHSRHACIWCRYCNVWSCSHPLCVQCESSKYTNSLFCSAFNGYRALWVLFWYLYWHYPFWENFRKTKLYSFFFPLPLPLLFSRATTRFNNSSYVCVGFTISSLRRSTWVQPVSNQAHMDLSLGIVDSWLISARIIHEFVFNECPIDVTNM